MLEKVIDKMISGKYYLTVIVGIVFAVLAIKGVLKPETTGDIIKTVIIFYFLKKGAQ